jgi:hypothetical protein
MNRVGTSLQTTDDRNDDRERRPTRQSAVVNAKPRADRAEARSDRFEIRSSEIVAEVLKYLCRRSPAVAVEQGPLTGPARLLPMATGSADMLLAVEHGDFIGGLGAAVCVSMDRVDFRIEGELERVTPGVWRLASPRLFSLDQRSAERLELDEGVAQLRWSEVRAGSLVEMTAPVDDLSSEGIGVGASGESSVPASVPFVATLDIDGRRFDCLAEPRHSQEGASGSRCGIKLHTRSRRAELIDTYLDHRFPQLVPRRDLDPESVHGLLERSGYLALRDDMKPPRDWFARSDDDAISRDVCFKAGDGQLIGHVSFTRAYSRAWLGHQLATIRNHSEAMACRRAIYLHIATYPTLVDGDDAMMVGYYDRGRPWHQRFFTGFVDWLSDPNLSVAYSLDRFERAAPNQRANVTFIGAEVGRAHLSELAHAAALVRLMLPPLVASALDIDPEHLTTNMLNGDYAGTRYERGREALVLRIGGKLSGVALCEVGSRQLSIFNLFNMAQCFVLPGTPVAAQLMLLDAVRAFYASRGESNPMIVSPPGTFQAQEESGTVLAETMGMIVWSGRALRQYENFIKYQFGRQLELVA